MNDFIFYNPCKVYFGKSQLKHLPEELLHYGKMVLLVYGGGSIKKNGLYEAVTRLMMENGFPWVELAGVQANPRHTVINKGTAICREKGVEVILAVGGGSVIDSAKGIAATAVSEYSDVWELVKVSASVEKALPIIVLLTSAATGSEMNTWSMVSNVETNEKKCLGGPGLLPKVAFENPEASFSLSKYQTACGGFDILNHVLDNYYFAGDSTFEITLELQEAVMRTAAKFTPIAVENPNNYEARANLMWASSLALSNILGDMHHGACHAIAHELSAYYDITHGHSLAIITPRWLQYIMDEKTAPAISRLGKKVFGLDVELDPVVGAQKSIEAVNQFCFQILRLQSTLTELGISDESFEEMAHHACASFPNLTIPGLRSLTPQDVKSIYKMCL